MSELPSHQGFETAGGDCGPDDAGVTSNEGHFSDNSSIFGYGSAESSAQHEQAEQASFSEAQSALAEQALDEQTQAELQSDPSTERKAMEQRQLAEEVRQAEARQAEQHLHETQAQQERQQEQLAQQESFAREAKQEAEKQRATDDAAQTARDSDARLQERTQQDRLAAEAKAQQAQRIDQNKLERAARSIEEFFGGQTPEVITNAAGDKIYQTDDRQLRFDINNPHGDKPHYHLNERKTTDSRFKDAGPKHRYYFAEQGASSAEQEDSA